LHQEIVFCLLIVLGLSEQLWIVSSVRVDAALQNTDLAHEAVINHKLSILIPDIVLRTNDDDQIVRVVLPVRLQEIYLYL